MKPGIRRSLQHVRRNSEALVGSRGMIGLWSGFGRTADA